MLLDENCTEQEAMKTLQNIYAKEIEKYGKEKRCRFTSVPKKKESAVMHLNNRLRGSQTVKDQVTDTTAKQMIIPYFS